MIGVAGLCGAERLWLVARNREIDASETDEAPGWQGAEEGEYREYLTDERRSQAGCIDGRSGIESPVTGH